MAVPIIVPRLGWNMDQGVFVGWLKADGATVRAGEPLFTLESEKSTEDIENFDDGILHIPADGPRQGDVLAVGAVIGFVLQPGEPPPSTIRRPPSAKDKSDAESGKRKAGRPVPRARDAPRPSSASTGETPNLPVGPAAFENAMSLP